MSGDSGGGDTTTTTVQQLSPQQADLIKLATPIMQQYLAGGTSGLSGMVYPGSTVAPPTANELAGQSMLKTQATGPLQGSVNQTLGGLNFLTSGAALDPRTNPALAGTINAAVRPLQENFGEVIMPGIRDEAILAGGYGSNRQDINERLAARDLSRSVGDVSSAIAFQGYNAGLDAMGRAQAFAPSVWQGSQIPGLTVSGIGAQERGFDQAYIQDEMQRWYNTRFLPLMIAQQIAGTAFGYPGGSTQVTAEGVQAPGVSPLAGALGGASIGTSILPGWGTAAGAGLGALLSLF